MEKPFALSLSKGTFCETIIFRHSRTGGYPRFRGDLPVTLDPRLHGDDDF